MKRDMDLARKILFDVENCGNADGSGYVAIEIEGHSEQEIMYHVQLLGEAGLIEIRDSSDSDGIRCWPTRLTWWGHEFIDAARDNTRWEKTKRLVMEQTGSLSFETLKAVLLKLANDALASHIVGLIG